MITQPVTGRQSLRRPSELTGREPNRRVAEQKEDELTARPVVSDARAEVTSLRHWAHELRIEV